MESNIKYEICENKKTVVAVLTVSENYFINEISNIIAKSGCSNFSIDSFKYSDAVKPKPCYVGIAKCCEEDDFDIETGKKIARLRAIKQLLNDRKKVINSIYKIFIGLCNRFYAADEYSKYADRNITDEIKKIGKFY